MFVYCFNVYLEIKKEVVLANSCFQLNDFNNKFSGYAGLVLEAAVYSKLQIFYGSS